ncbi:hypothetical protein GALL_44700 [mine drainage metagenome]|uniref:Uncharacterized protein n=1 Tax=mine drainage metagenome TaxID=410659 RepID=A0A1J5TER8_9ZZZZ
MNQKVDASDQLRSVDCVYEPDPRTKMFVRLDIRTGDVYPRVLADQYGAIAFFKLHETVPSVVLVHFETAKNLYLYAWFVYRFYPVAEQQALASLEFALRERLPDFVAAEKRKHRMGFEPGLKSLLGYAVKEGIVRNEKFSTRERWARKRAESRYRFQKSEEMRNTNVDSLVIDESEAVVTQEDLDCDWLNIFLETIPSIRNDYAHGSRTLRNNVLHSFELVTEIINQLYPKAEIGA